MANNHRKTRTKSLQNYLVELFAWHGKILSYPAIGSAVCSW